MSFEPLYFPTLVIVVVKHLKRNTHERKFPPFSFVFSFGKKHIWPVVKRSHGQNNNTNGDGCGGLSLMRARIPTDVMCSIRDGGTMLTLAGWIEKQTKKVQLFTKVWAKK